LAYRIKINRAAQKQVLSFPEEAQAEIAQLIDRLKGDPRPPRVRKLADSGLWRIRAGRIRVVYAIDDEARLIIIVRAARRREDTYKGL
jgi:mRNA-degrading endonuclease RelE of RelBE toxin-antitoxin system